MRNAQNEQLKAIELERQSEALKGNPVIAQIHAENPDVVFPQIPKLMTLPPPLQTALAATSSHTPPEQVLTLDRDKLFAFIKNQDMGVSGEKTVLNAIKQDYGGQTPEGGRFRFYGALAYEKQPFYTPREVIFKQYASMPQIAAASFQTNLKSSDIDAFTLNHEIGHKRSYDLGLRDPGELVGVQNSTEIQALQNKKDQVIYGGEFEPYGRYLEESFSDTYSAIQRLKHGVDVDVLQTVNDAREHGVMHKENAYIYPTHTSLKHVVENAESLQKKLAGASQQEVVEMTAGIVGTQSYDREQYYEHGMAAMCQVERNKNGQSPTSINWEQTVKKDKNHPASKLWEGYCLRQPKGFLARLKGNNKEDQRPSMNEGFANSYQKHGIEDVNSMLQARSRLTNAPSATPEHLQAEVLGQLKYVVSKHPDKTLEQVLREREAFIKAQYAELGEKVPQSIRDVNDGVRAHLSAKRAASLEREQAAEITKGEGRQEQTQDLNPKR